MQYRKIPIISPGLIFVQKAFLVGLYSGELIFGGAYYWREFYVSKWAGLIIGRIFATEIWGAYFREGLILGGLIIGILG